VPSKAQPPAADRQGVIDQLEGQLRNTPRASRPYEHAAIAYRLGLAYAESPLGNPQDSMRKALACYDVAAAIFDPRFDPVEHARVLNAAGAVHRALGDRARAEKFFSEASSLLDGHERDGERAAALNNLGLVRTELGRPLEAAEAFDAAVELFDTTTAEGSRGKVATLHNRGQAHASLGTDEGLEAALADFEEAKSDLDVDDAPYHAGLLQHSIGVTCSALAGRTQDDEERRAFLQEAVRAFKDSLDVFTRSGFPFQHALAKHNLGLAYLALGGATNQRRALACFEDAVAILDTRMHADAWRQAYASLERVEKELTTTSPGFTRADHFAALAAVVPSEERRALVYDRLWRLLATPDARLRIAELAYAVAKLGEEDAAPIIEHQITLLMEQPAETQDTGLRAIYDGHERLEGDAREDADRALDKAIGEALGGPQRVYVRDFFYSLGWERP
jgi:tetratricopeptide (TPR) repeat protein